jgi:aldose 1-epimerase
VQLQAQTRIVVDEERKLPIGREPLDGSAEDFRTPRRLGDQQVDLAFTDLARDAAGLARASLSAPDGTTVELWADEGYPFLELYTGDGLSPERRRRGLGVEPMTCAPNAFQSGEGLARLEPGETFAATWGVRLL